MEWYWYYFMAFVCVFVFFAGYAIGCWKTSRKNDKSMVRLSNSLNAMNDENIKQMVNRISYLENRLQDEEDSSFDFEINKEFFDI